MRCPKCQYLGFEPSPRCKNCGYDFSFGSDDLSSLTIIPETNEPGALEDFDLQVIDGAASRSTSAAIAGGFDLDDLLSRGRSEPVLEVEFKPAAVVTASAVATPPPAEVVKMVEDASATVVAAARAVAASPRSPAPRAARVPVPPSVPLSAPALAPVTTELPLFMQVMSETAATAAPRTAAVRAGMPLTIEAATQVVESAPAVEEVDDRPLVQVPAVPRPPLAVRRATPDPARLRAKYARAAAKAEAHSAAGDLLLGIDDAEVSPVRRTPMADRLSAEPTPESLPAGWLQGVSAGKRVWAAGVDVLLLGSINAAVVWFTLGVLGLEPSQAHLLPLLPIALFFLLVDGGYLVLFTAACGQTIGKMAAGIRVVGTTTGAVINDRITLGQAFARAIGAIISCVPLGAGFWVSLVGDGRALHDKIAHTRVVRA